MNYHKLHRINTAEYQNELNEVFNRPKMTKSLKALTVELEKLQKTEKHNPFAHLTPDDLINPQTYAKVASEIDAGNADFKDFSNIIDAALIKRGTEDKSYIKKVGDAVGKSFQDAGRGAYNNVLEALKQDTQKKLSGTPANYIFKTPEGKYDIDLEVAQNSPMAAEPLKYIDISKENAGEIYKKLKIASNTSDSFTVDRLSKEFSKKAPLKDIAESTSNINEVKRDIWNATNGLKEYPYSRAELLEHAHLFDEVPSYITMHPETPKEDLINEIKSSDELHYMPEIFNHPNLNPTDIKQALTARDASGKQFSFDAPDMDLRAKNRREIDNNLAALEHLVETSKSHDTVPNFELKGNISKKDAHHAVNKLLELKKKHLNSGLPERIHDSLNESITKEMSRFDKSIIDYPFFYGTHFDDTNGPLFKRIASGEFAAKDSKGKIKENKLLDLVLSRFSRSNDDLNPSEHFNQFLHSVIDSKHRPSIVKMAEKMGHTFKKEHLDKIFENGKFAASFAHRLPTNMLASIMSNPEYMGKIEPHLTQEQKDKLNKVRYAAMYSKDDAPINFSNNTEILRKFRDVVEANGGTLSAKQLGQFGLNENALKVAHLKDAKGNYTTEAIQKHIDSMPKHTYNFSHTTWSGAQRHTGEKQRVFQLNHTPEMMDELENAGVLDTFLTASKISKQSGHPVKDNTLGWVRYTKGKDGNIHIDEIQSDLGRGLHGAVRDELDRSDLSPQKREKYAKLFAKDKVDKMSDILFKNQHPSKILHEGFLQFLRNSGHTGKQVHIWQAMPKAKIAGQKTGISIPLNEIPRIERAGRLVEQNKPIELEDLGFMTNLALNHKEAQSLYNKHSKEGELNKEAYKQDLINHPMFKHIINHLKDNQDKIEEAKTKGMHKYRVPLNIEHLPVHMKVGYQETPPKMGYEQGSYGSIDTQKESGLHNEPTWQAPLRKSLKSLLAEYEKLTKADYLNGTYYPDHVDAAHKKRHPTKNHLVGHYGKNGEPTWTYNQALANTYDKNLTALIMGQQILSKDNKPLPNKLNSLSKENIDLLKEHALNVLLKDPDRHVMAANTDSSKPKDHAEVRVRHLINALTGSDGYELKNSPTGGFEIYAPRHSDSDKAQDIATRWTFHPKKKRFRSERIYPTSTSEGGDDGKQTNKP